MKRFALWFVLAGLFAVPSLAAQTASRDEKTAKDIEVRVESIRDLWGSEDRNYRRFARVPGRPDLVPVPDDDHWPKAATTSYVLMLDAQGKPLVLNEVPSAVSGDEVSYFHFFDENGRTILFAAQVELSGGRCGEAATQVEESFYTADFRLIKRERETIYRRGRSGAACPPYRFTYNVHPDLMSTEIGNALRP